MQGVAANYEVVGASIVANGEGWNNNAAANLMTTDDGGATYTLTIEGVTLDAGTNYEYKIVEKGSWTEYFPNNTGGSNATFSVSETGVYTIKYVYTVSTSSCEVQTTKTGEAGAITHTYTVAGEPASLFGTVWTPSLTDNDMVESATESGVYTWTKENVVLDGTTAIKFRVCQDHALDVAYPSGNFDVNAGHGYTGAGTYNVTISFDSKSGIITPVFTLQAAQDAPITSVAIKGAYASDTEWANAKTLPLKGSENVYTSPIAIDMSTTLEDFVFGLVVNGTFVNFTQVTIDPASASLLVDDGTDHHNILFKNSTSGYQTYTATATWTPGPDATAGWTLKVTGVDPRVLEYYLVGDLTGGFPGSDTDQTKDVKMTKQSNGLYTYEVASFAAEAQKYEYKLRANKIWGLYELPSSGNNDYTFTEAGNYKLTFTANVTGEEIDGIAGYTLTLNAERLPDPVVLPGTAIWENTTGVTPDWSGPFAEIASDKFADVNVGDIIHVAVQNVTAGEAWSAQAVIFDGYGVQLEGGTPVGDGTQTVASYVVTGDMLALLKANGMRVGGNKYTTTKVSVESPVYTGSENSIWVGDLALAWTPQATVSKYHFINSKVKEGDVIKLSYESTGSPNIQILPGDWSGSYGTVEYGDGFATLVVTAGNESVLMDKGLIVNADGITLKQIELLAENRVTEKNMTITDGRHILSNEFDQYPDDYKVVLSISNNNDPFVSVDGWGIGKGFYLDNWESATTDKMLDIAGKGGKTFEVIITVGDLKETAKNGGDSYIGNSNYPQGGVTFNIWSGCKLESAKVLIPVYYFITGENDAWTVGDEITAAEGVYSATAKGAGKLFAIARASSLNTAGDDVTDWKTIVRPVTTDGNFIVNFANYSDNTMSGEGKVWQIGATNDADVTINYTPADGKFAISCQTEVEIGELGYSTYSNSQKYAVSGDGISANFISVSGDVATLTEVEAGAVLPNMAVTNAAGKNGGVILKGTAGAKATINSVALDAEVTAAGVADNLMAGSGDYEYQLGTQFADGDEYIAYILYKNDAGEAAFMKWDGSDEPLAAHKAFLAVPKTNAAPQFIIFGGEGTTGIEAVTPSQRTGQYYTLDGRRVENPTKGLYIINGKKVVIK